MKEGARSAGRIASDCVAVAESMDFTESSRAVRRVTHPSTLTGTMRKTGIALAVAPEPVTTVAGVALIAGSFIAKGREPASLGTLAEEAATEFSELFSLAVGLPAITL